MSDTERLLMVRELYNDLLNKEDTLRRISLEDYEDFVDMIGIALADVIEVVFE